MSNDREDSKPDKPTGRSLFAILASVLAMLHFLIILGFFAPGLSTPDAQGYFTQARLIAEKGRTYIEPESIVQYIAPHWHPAKGDHYFSKYPPGLPALLAVFFRIGGPAAATLIIPLLASLTLLGLFFFSRELVCQKWALVAEAVMAFNPPANEHALFGDSHIAVCFFLIWGLYFLFRWLKTDSLGWAVAAGLFIGMIPTIRYPEILLCAAVLLYIILNLKRDRKFLMSLAGIMIAAILPLLILFIRNQLAFGAFWKTGYGASQEQIGFGVNYFLYNAIPYLQKLMSEGCGLTFGLGIIGITLMCSGKATRTGALFASLILPLTILYMAYFWKPDPQSMRFLLPTFGIYTAAGIWLLYTITRESRSYSIACAAVLILITALWGIPLSLQPMLHLMQHNRVTAHIGADVGMRISPGDIIITCEGVNQFLSFIGAWRLADDFYVSPERDKLREIYMREHSYDPHREGRNIAARTKYRPLTSKEAFAEFRQDILKWSDGKRKVYWIEKKERIDAIRAELPETDSMTGIAKIDIPLIPFLGPPGMLPPPGGGNPMIGRGDSPPGKKKMPMGYDRIFDLDLDGESLQIVEWKIK